MQLSSARQRNHVLLRRTSFHTSGWCGPDAPPPSLSLSPLFLPKCPRRRQQCEPARSGTAPSLLPSSPSLSPSPSPQPSLYRGPLVINQLPYGHRPRLRQRTQQPARIGEARAPRDLSGALPPPFPPWSQPNRSSCECGGVRGLQEAARHAPHHLAGAVHGAVHRGDGGELKDMHVALCRGVGGGERMEGRDGRVPGPDGWSNVSSAASRRQYDPPVHALCTPLTLKLGNLTICLAVGACTEMRRPSPRLSTLHA